MSHLRPLPNPVLAGRTLAFTGNYAYALDNQGRAYNLLSGEREPSHDTKQD